MPIAYENIYTCNGITENDSMSLETLGMLTEAIMNKRKQIEEKYDVKQLPSDGRWWCKVDGKVIKKVSKEKLIDFLINHEKSVVQERTINTIIKEYLSYRWLSKSAGTYRQDIRYYENFIKESQIANIPISEITLSDGVTWSKSVLEKRPNMTPKYWNNVRGSLLSILHFDNCHVLDNLNIHVDKLTVIEHDNDSRIFLPEEKAAVKKLAKEEALKVNDSIPLGIVFLFNTGIRTGELCSLKWKDISDTHLHIHTEMIENSDEDGNFKGYKVVSHTKTKAGTRDILLTNELKSILTTIKRINFSKGISCGKDDFVFRRIKKDEIVPVNTRCFDSRLRRYCKEAGMEELKSQHDIRRTFATDLYYAGMNLKDIQKIMGHGSMQQTQAYIHFREIENEELLMNAINS